jgi:hypothetical protein
MAMGQWRWDNGDALRQLIKPILNQAKKGSSTYLPMTLVLFNKAGEPQVSELQINYHTNFQNGHSKF